MILPREPEHDSSLCVSEADEKKPIHFLERKIRKSTGLALTITRAGPVVVRMFFSVNYRLI